MPDKAFRFGPLALTSTYTTNILNPGTTTGGTNSTASPYGNLRIVLYHIKVTNITNGAVTFRLFIGATGANTAGTELEYDRSVPANSDVDLWFPSGLPLDTANFLVGGASAATSLTIQGEGVEFIA